MDFLFDNFKIISRAHKKLTQNLLCKFYQNRFSDSDTRARAKDIQNYLKAHFFISGHPKTHISPNFIIDIRTIMILLSLLQYMRESKTGLVLRDLFC